MYEKGRGARQDFIRAYMWDSLAAAALSSDVGQAAMKHRDHLASQMTDAQIERAQETARRCQDTKLKECD